MSEGYLATYLCHWSVSPDLFDGCLTPCDSGNLRRRAASSHTNDRREEEATDDDDDDDDDDDIEEGMYRQQRFVQWCTRRREGLYSRFARCYRFGRRHCNIVTTTPKCASEIQRSTRFVSVATAETALCMSRAVPVGTDNVLVVLHSNIVSYFHNDDAGVAGFVHLFPDGCSGPEYPSRQQAISL